jgi:hypothetical protein
MFRRGLEIQEEGMREKGIEESKSLNLKLYKMRRAIEIIKTLNNEGWIDKAEEIIGKKSSWSDDNYDFFAERSEEQRDTDREILSLAHKIQKEEWKELWKIIEGQDRENISYDEYDGSDIRGWWD